MSHEKNLAPTAMTLDALAERVRQDRVDLCLPPTNWVPAHYKNGNRVLDAVIVGGGMCGLLVYHALTSGGIRNIAVFDRAPEGLEGPWITYARMETLRSPKHLTGPAYGHASLTFRAWFRAQFGADAWEALDKIPRPMWMDYLQWYRRILGIEVQNQVSVDLIEPDGELLKLSLGGPNANADSLLTRKLIMATGRDGTGKPYIPTFVDGVQRSHWAHSADPIDFAALRGKRVAVVGAGASAVENAAEALEAGASEVRHLVRRREMPTINKMMGIGSYGFSCGFAALPDEWRWRFMRYSFVTQTPPPRGSTLRASRHRNAYFHFGKAVVSVRHEGDQLNIGFADGTATTTDYLILATGFTVDPHDRSEFGAAADEVQLWRDVYTPPADEQHSALGNFPYLNPDFSFRPKDGSEAHWLSNVYCFNYGASVSLGKVSGDIPGISEGASWLCRDIAASLYSEDVALHWQTLQDYDKPELRGDEWEPTELPATASEYSRNTEADAL